MTVHDAHVQWLEGVIFDLEREILGYQDQIYQLLGERSRMVYTMRCSRCRHVCVEDEIIINFGICDACFDRLCSCRRFVRDNEVFVEANLGGRCPLHPPCLLPWDHEGDCTFNVKWQPPAGAWDEVPPGTRRCTGFWPAK